MGSCEWTTLNSLWGISNLDSSTPDLLLLRTYNQLCQSSLRFCLKICISKTPSLELRLVNTLGIRGHQIKPLYFPDLSLCFATLLSSHCWLLWKTIKSLLQPKDKRIGCSHQEDYKIYLILFPYPLPFQDPWEMASQF